MGPTARDQVAEKRPQGAGLLCRASSSSGSRALDERTRTATFVAATERPVDSWVGPEILRVSGAKLERFQKNPIVLDAHRRDDASRIVGRASVRVEGRELVADVTFAETPRAEELWQLVRQGFLRAVSVGFTPVSFVELRKGQSDGEGESRVEGPAVVIHEWDLCEISLVPLPADEDAVLRRSFYGARRATENPPMTALNARAEAAPAADAPAKSDLAMVAEKLGLPETATLAEVLAALDEEETPAGEESAARESARVEARAAELARARTEALERKVADLETSARAIKAEANRREIEQAREACASAGDPTALDADLEKDVLADFARGDDTRARRELARAVEQARGSGRRALLSESSTVNARAKKAAEASKAEAKKILDSVGSSAASS